LYFTLLAWKQQYEITSALGSEAYSFFEALLKSNRIQKLTQRKKYWNVTFLIMRK